MSKVIELLAPARNIETGIAAIHCGADAVYIAAQKFGARRAAGNPMADIEKLIQEAHRYRSKVYLTLNTLLYDSELDEALAIIRDAWNAGIDALIIQDMGLLECDLPPVPLIASTQTDNRTPEKVRFLEEVGFQRAILARELTLEEIRAIRAQTTLELEFFVHGALCMSYSGQCYLSRYATGRSANRGECAQLCRLAYSLMDGSGEKLITDRHLLSLKDLNLSGSLEELIDAGITSFKIEGRLKDTAYVKNITSFYRKQMDAILESHSGLKKASSGNVTFYFEPDPEKTFNRGYSSHFLHGRTRGQSEVNTPKSTGKYLGKVSNIGASCFTLDWKADISNGDGLCFFGPDQLLTGFMVNRVDQGRIYPNEWKEMTPGTDIYRNYDRKFEKILEGNIAERKIRVDLVLSETPEGYVLEAVDEDGITGTDSRIQEKTVARNAEKAMNSIQDQLAKTGGTIFSVGNIRLNFSEPWFIPIAVLNGLRRGTLGALGKNRIASYPSSCAERRQSKALYPYKSLDYRGNILNDKAGEFYKKHGVEEIRNGFESDPPPDAALMTTRFCLRFEQGLCPRQHPGKAGEIPAELFLSDGRRTYKLAFDCANCEMKIYPAHENNLIL